MKMFRPTPNKRLKRSTTASRRRGATAVEFAVTCGLLFMFFFASIEFSRVTSYRHTVENALYEGARAGIMPGATNEDVVNKTTQILRRSGIYHANVEVSPERITNATESLRVRIRMELDRGLYGPAFYFLGKTLDRSFEMQREGVQSLR